MPDPESHGDEPGAEPTVHELLLTEIDTYIQLIEEVQLRLLEQAIDQLHPERSRSCRTELTMV
jgi:hypothetical protein